MIQKTFLELNDLDGMVGEKYKLFPNLKDSSKFGFAYKKFYRKNLKEIFDDYFEELEAIRINNALVDEKTKALLLGDGGMVYKYSKDGKMNVLKEERALNKDWFERVFEIEPYFVKPENLTEFNEMELELMKGILVE